MNNIARPPRGSIEAIHDPLGGKFFPVIVVPAPGGTSRVMAAGETWREPLKQKGERIQPAPVSLNRPLTVFVQNGLGHSRPSLRGQ